MFQIDDITTLTEFQRNAKEHIKRLKKSGRPELLTVNGKVELVVLDATAYQKLADAAELAETLPVLRRSLHEAKRSEGISAAKVPADIRVRLGLKKR